ncbi:MAG: substrate-binding domain-containing protein [Prevotella sp.]|jgi:phosphate transport system substrate-binding protein|nr:substrate-binding domain-containing protein [Prevotella sp.]MBP3745295.1 substrate-binding domain-containing protein [Prevotella sp.]MBQ3741339.1 substrate-binding domain-containing protein [Prevotella sp.]MBQ6422797.1 substrate-binding domain-containing protein [Prevotella sp.]MDY6439211.1 substrate-binding domain-containing protein [Prevotella sp.]
MKRTTFYNLVGFILLTSFCSCSGEKKPVNGRTDTPTSGTIEFVSDESFSPIIEELRKQFEFKFPKAHLQPRYTNEIEGLQMIKDLKTCLFITSRGLLPSEIAYLKTKRQLPQVFPIGYDGLALIVNRANQDTCITVADVKRVLSGQAKDWADVVPGSKRGNIEVVFDNQSSATLHYVVDSILGGKPINSTNIVAAKTSKEVINYVDRTPNAIGVIGSNWLNDHRDSTNTTFKKNINVMSVSVKDKATPMNSWKPYQAYMLDGRYPFVRTLYAIVVDPQKGLPNSFANYIAGPTGQLIIFKSGLLPYRGDIMVKTVSTRRK